ncbi:acetylglutamate kinase [Aspergillus luchuensis]|uniref:Acetylglutamate kinase n=1 Tax=Aspergillus kawachii TaxID=1069201 RepID=A0A146FMF2_ASPKA|nr:acetylglutamate kinase [Aspergillus luchuensis]
MPQIGVHRPISLILIESDPTKNTTNRYNYVEPPLHPNFLHCDRLSRISSDGSIAPPPPVPSNKSATWWQIGSLLCTRPIALQRASLRAAYIPPYGFPPLTPYMGGQPATPSEPCTWSEGVSWAGSMVSPLQALKQRSLVPTQ